ncbi:hypothetical protein BAJUN_01830 [Bajunvirus bajun]|uniref:Uncharacterized protein n=1 Tax=Brevundimonas phage vB_BgoS-Bajun TaxID=2948594 RepID=A0A9E7N4N1_9CAUD|nr:hypothetical protein BAJUN_01830 [Brevundimonas phage vB_BgoS-Bajun]
MTFPVYTATAASVGAAHILRDGQAVLYVKTMRDPSDSTRPLLSDDALGDLVEATAERLTGATLDRADAVLLARVLDPAFATTDADLAQVRAALNFALQDAPGEKQAARRRLAEITPEQRARIDRDVAQAQGVATYQGYACLAYVDRIGGVVIKDSTDGRDAYVQPGDDAAALRAELEAAEGVPEPTTSAALGPHDLIENILREYF